MPNSRSSHSQVTPRGGGLAIAIVFFLGLIGLYALHLVSLRHVAALLGGGFLVALVGWLDDRNSLSPKLRASVHIIAAFWAVVWLGGYSSLNMGFARLPLGLVGSVLAIIGIAWMINLYNFMDGIDGIAAGEAVVVSGAAGVILWMAGLADLSAIAVLLAAAAAGFLVWNWPPAKIFMGDVGSGLLGFILGTMAVASENSGGLPALGWLMLLGVFVVDATATLVRRGLAGERLYEAHRTHAYQLLAAHKRNHRAVTTRTLVLSLVLALVTWMAWRWPSKLFLAFVVVMGGLLLGWWRVVHQLLPVAKSPLRHAQSKVSAK